jgi:hypothetical protein
MVRNKPNFSFLGCLEVVFLWLEKYKKYKTKRGRIKGFGFKDTEDRILSHDYSSQ